MSTPTTARNNDKLKIYNSSVYRKKIKRMVEMTKTVRGIYNKIPKGPLPALKATASPKDKKKHEDASKLHLSISSIHYFAAPFTGYAQASEPAPQAEST